MGWMLRGWRSKHDDHAHDGNHPRPNLADTIIALQVRLPILGTVGASTNSRWISTDRQMSGRCFHVLFLKGGALEDARTAGGMHVVLATYTESRLNR